MALSKEVVIMLGAILVVCYGVLSAVFVMLILQEPDRYGGSAAKHVAQVHSIIVIILLLCAASWTANTHSIWVALIPVLSVIPFANMLTYMSQDHPAGCPDNRIYVCYLAVAIQVTMAFAFLIYAVYTHRSTIHRLDKKWKEGSHGVRSSYNNNNNNNNLDRRRLYGV